MRFFEIATTDLDLLLFHKKATTHNYKLLLLLLFIQLQQPLMTLLCESTAAEAVDDMQRMNVADRMKNGRKRPTEGGGPKTDHNTKGRTKRPTGGRRGTHTGNTQTRPHSEKSLDTVCGEVPRRAPQSLAWRW